VSQGTALFFKLCVVWHRDITNTPSKPHLLTYTFGNLYKCETDLPHSQSFHLFLTFLTSVSGKSVTIMKVLFNGTSDLLHIMQKKTLSHGQGVLH
jgi:hypothetical protein